MMQGILYFGVVFVGTVLIIIFGRNENGPWKYRGIRWFWRMGRKKGWQFPEWIGEKMILRTWILLFGGSFLLAVGGIAKMTVSEPEITRLKRPEYGQGSIQEELALEWEEENGRKGEEEMFVEIGEQSLSGKEVKNIFHQVKEELGETVLGENLSADMVKYPLHLPEKLDGFPVSIDWISSDPDVVDWEGNLGKEISEEGELVCLTASMELGEEEDSYFQYVRVYPPETSFQDEVQSFLKEENEKKEGSWMELPEQLRGRKLSWKKNREDLGTGTALLIFICPFLLLLRDKQAAQDRKKLERQQMIQDYPEILSKLTLLLSAGVNLRKAMERIGKDYVNYKKDGEERKAYEVILEICSEMDRGISEREAYERLGEQCEVLSYRTLSALLVQHLQKGSRGIERMLEEEAQKAQELRQQQAKILGEQASTKLLVPMILMLLVVFVILLVPAWLSFAL